MTEDSHSRAQRRGQEVGACLIAEMLRQMAATAEASDTADGEVRARALHDAVKAIVFRDYERVELDDMAREFIDRCWPAIHLEPWPDRLQLPLLEQTLHAGRNALVPARYWLDRLIEKDPGEQIVRVRAGVGVMLAWLEKIAAIVDKGPPKIGKVREMIGDMRSLALRAGTAPEVERIDSTHDALLATLGIDDA